MVCDCAVNALLVENGQVVGVSTQAGNRYARNTVLAAGLGTLDLLARHAMHLPIRPSPAILIQFDVAHDFLNGIVSNAEIYSRISSVVAKIGSIKGIYCIEKVTGLKSWDELLQAGNKYDHPEELETLRNLRRLASRESASGRLPSTGQKGVRSAAA